MNNFAKNKSYPHQRELDFQKQMLNMQDLGRQNGIYNQESMVAQTKKMITEDTISSILLNPTFGNTSSLYDLMEEAGVMVALPKEKRIEFIERAKSDPELFEELANRAAEGIERIIYNQGYAPGKAQFDKENATANAVRNKRVQGTAAQMLDAIRNNRSQNA
jgi:hypothetical protein